jgi:hypothetical protein
LTIAVVVGAMMPLRIGSPVRWCGAYGNGKDDGGVAENFRSVVGGGPGHQDLRIG